MSDTDPIMSSPASSLRSAASATAPAVPAASPAAAPAAVLFRATPDSAAALALSFIGGFVDASGYVGLYGLFTGSITGNVVVAASTVSGATYGVIPRVVVTATFVGGVALSHAVACAVARASPPPGGPQRATARALLVLEALALGGAWLAGQLLGPAIAEGGAGGASVTFVGALMGLSMGFQNGAVKEALPGFPATTVMTSTLVSCGSQLAAWALAGAAACLPGRAAGAPAAAAKAGHALLKSSLPLLLFIGGACLGSALQYLIQFHSLCVPVALLCALVALLTL
jgi:uncharacterized membrane protein YoaK (UPF0700 family)